MTRIEFMKKVRPTKYSYPGLPLTFKEDAYIDVKCDIHGVFKQKASEQLEGAECPACRYTRVDKDRKKPFKVLEEEAKEIFEDKLTLNPEGYKNAHSPIKIHCNVCGTDFLRRPTDLIYYKCGCPECSKLEKSTIALAQIDPDTPTILYYLLDKVTGYYKIGITTRTLEERYSKTLLEDLEVIYESPRISHSKALEMEQRILNTFKEFRVINDRFKHNGAYEFFSTDVLGFNQQ